MSIDGLPAIPVTSADFDNHARRRSTPPCDAEPLSESAGRPEQLQPQRGRIGSCAGMTRQLRRDTPSRRRWPRAVASRVRSQRGTWFRCPAHGPRALAVTSRLPPPATISVRHARVRDRTGSIGCPATRAAAAASRTGLRPRRCWTGRRGQAQSTAPSRALSSDGRRASAPRRCRSASATVLIDIGSAHASRPADCTMTRGCRRRLSTSALHRSGRAGCPTTVQQFAAASIGARRVHLRPDRCAPAAPVRRWP